MKCAACNKETVTVNLTIPNPPWTLNPHAPKQIVGKMERYCLDHYNKIYGLTKQQEK